VKETWEKQRIVDILYMEALMKETQLLPQNLKKRMKPMERKPKKLMKRKSRRQKILGMGKRVQKVLIVMKRSRVNGVDEEDALGPEGGDGEDPQGEVEALGFDEL
jgi:hypothetical protein